MKKEHKIELGSMQAHPVSQKGRRLHAIKRWPRPFELVKYKRATPEKKHAKPFYHKVLIQCGICVLVCGIALGMSRINFKPLNEAAEGLKMVLNYESNLDNLKWFDSMTVSTADDAFLTPPVNGELQGMFEAGESNAGLVYACGDSVVTAAADGRVFYVDDVRADGPYIRIRHDSGFDTLYIGVVGSTKVGDDVKQGQVVGRCVSTSMGFVLLRDGEVVDPRLYMMQKGADHD